MPRRRLHDPQKWTYFYLYAVIDIYSRFVVGRMVADRESFPKRCDDKQKAGRS